MATKRIQIIRVDVGHTEAGMGGPYTVLRRRANKIFGKEACASGYGCGFDMEQGFYIRGKTVKEVKDILGDKYQWVSVERCTGIRLDLGKCAFVRAEKKK